MDKNDVLELICSREETDIFDLLYETCIPCATLKKMLGECVSEGKLQTADGISYTYTGKKMSPAGGGEKNDDKKETDDEIDDEIDDETDDKIDVDALLEEMLREFEAEEKGDGGQQTEEDVDTEEPDTVELDDDMSKLDMDRAKYLLSCMKNSVRLEEREGEVNICVRGLSFSVRGVEIGAVIEDGQLYLSDRGRTLAYLSERTENREELLRRAEEIAADCGVEVEGNSVLRIEVPIFDFTLAAFVHMYEAIARLLLLRSS